MTSPERHGHPREPTFVRHAGPGAFLDRAEAWLLDAEAEHNLILSLSYARRERGVDADALFATVEEPDGRVAGCVIRTPPHKLLVTRMPSAAAPIVAEAVDGIYEEIPAVLGPPEVARAVGEAWVAVRGGTARPGMAQRIYRLDEVVPPPPVDGRHRPSTDADLELLYTWGEGFGRDAGAFRPTAAAIRRMHARGDMHLWEVDGRPVSMTVAQGPTPHGRRIGFVYTPPEERGRGYATALVAEVSRRMLERGLDFCVLYTDLANPTSNAIYKRVGYRPLADVLDVDIEPPPGRRAQMGPSTPDA